MYYGFEMMSFIVPIIVILVIVGIFLSFVLERQVKICPVRRNQRINHIIHTPAGKQMRFQLVCVYIHARFLDSGLLSEP